MRDMQPQDGVSGLHSNLSTAARQRLPVGHANFTVQNIDYHPVSCPVILYHPDSILYHRVQGAPTLYRVSHWERMAPSEL